MYRHRAAGSIHFPDDGRASSAGREGTEKALQSAAALMAKPTAPAAEDPRARFLVKFEPGQTIFEQGRPGAEMFVIQEGQVEILRRVGPMERRLAMLEAGDFFGEMSVLEDLPRSATARAVSAAKLLPIDASTFDQMLREHPEIAVRMMRRLSRRLRQRDESDARAQEIVAGPLAGVAHSAANPEPVTLDVREQPAPAAPPAPATAQARLVHANGTTFAVVANGESRIGRFDPVTNLAPEIDLGPLDTERSLSRRHARISGRDGGYFLREEIGTANGTFAGGVRLETGKERQIRDGEALRFGQIEMIFRGA
jgi:CRP-like cAMP-binding protein